jgi:replicative DNA helicase
MSIEAEEHVLGAIMLSPWVLDIVTEHVTAADFYRGSHGVIFTHCLQLQQAGQEITPITIVASLDASNVLNDIGGSDRIREIATLVPAATNAAHHARVVREMALRRRMISAGQAIAELGWQPGDDLQAAVASAEEIAYGLSDGSAADEILTAKQIADETWTLMEAQAASNREIIGVATGYRDVDRLTGGLRPGNLVVLAGRPSMGKSGYMLGAAVHAAVHDHTPTAVFSYEMSRIEIMQRLYSSLGRVSTDKVMTPRKLAADDWAAIARASQRVSDAPLFIDESGAKTITHIRSAARRLKTRHGLGLVIVDYLQLMTSGARADNRNIELSQISRGLKMLSTELGIPVLAISQLSRDLERRHDKRPMLSDLRDSGAIEQDADLVLFLYRDDYYYGDDTDDEARGTAEVIIAKHRNGPVGMRRLAFIEHLASFGDLARDPDPAPPPRQTGESF